MKTKSKKAVVLLSGGLDSTTVLYYAKARGYDCHCLLFSYGQKHTKELACARKVAERAGVPFQVVRIGLPWGGSSLIGKGHAIPQGKASTVSKDLPSTYVPGRNTIFISFALSFAETIGAHTVFIGANAIDYSGYPDCRPKYYDAWNGVLKALATGVNVKVPLLHLNKAQIVRLGAKLGVPFELTWSCYAGGKEACGICESCTFRAKGFREAGVIDTSLRCKK
jgi:7-cyano-7-deazaguanine synthase